MSPAAPSAADAAPRTGPGLRSSVTVAVATGIGNALVYVLYAALSRTLGPTSYGAFAALAGVGLVVAVPAIAIQAVVARHVAVRRLDDPAGRAELRGLFAWSNRLAVLLVLAGLVLSPAVVAFLHLPGWGAALATAVWLWPVTMTGAYLGVLQGAGRFGAFGRLFVLSAGLRLVGGLAGAVAGKAAGMGLTGAVVGTVAGGLLTVAIAARMVGVAPVGAARGEWRPLAREMAGASGGLLGVIVLSSIDLVLARHFLTGHQSGLYAVGAIVSKCAFWLPAFVGYVFYRDFTDPERRRAAVAKALVAVVGLGLAGVAVTALLAEPAIRIASGTQYDAVAGDAWLFAALGAAVACVQLLVYAGIAAGSHRLAHLVWVAVVIECVLLGAVLHDSVRQIVGGALAVNLLLAAVGAAWCFRGREESRDVETRDSVVTAAA